MKYLNPRADLTFKRVFGEHPDLVMSFLNALLPLKQGEEIMDIEYLPSDLVPENPLRKYSIVDVRCVDKVGRQFLVEMQMLWSPEFRQRILFNASKAYVRQLKKGEQYELLQPVYSLNLINEVFEPELEGYYHHYSLVHVEHSNKIIDGLQLIFVELPKFNPHNLSEKKMQLLWLRFLTEIDEDTRKVPEELATVPEISKALSILQESAFSDAEMYGYEKFWDGVSIEKTLYNSGMRKGLAEGLAEGMAKGIAKGEAKGEAKGLEKGLEKGRAEGEAKGKLESLLQVASSLKNKGMDMATIMDCTGLDEPTIAAL